MRILVLLFIFLASIMNGGISTHDYITEDGIMNWTSQESPEDTSEDLAKKIFEEFFLDEEIMDKPDGVNVIDVQIINGELMLNVSKEIKNYGGTYYETCFRNEIIKTGLSVPGVTKVTLYIENKLTYLTEGSIIKEETAWQE